MTPNPELDRTANEAYAQCLPRTIELTDEERADFDNLPPTLAASLRQCTLEYGRRFFVAWHADFPKGILRHKSLERTDDMIWPGIGRAGTLTGWQTRTWTAFDGRMPIITDVTAAIPGLWRAILATPGRCWGRDVRIVFLPPKSLDVCGVGALATGAIDLTDSVDRHEFEGTLTARQEGGGPAPPGPWPGHGAR